MRSQPRHSLFCADLQAYTKPAFLGIALLVLFGLGAAMAAAQTSPGTSAGKDSSVFRTVGAWTYRSGTGSWKVLFRGTELMPGGTGEAYVENKGNRVEIEAKLKNMGDATQFGLEYLTYVLWAVSPQGRAVNLGEVQVKDGSAKVKAITDMQTFALVVTAEPYFAVSQPGDRVVLEDAIGNAGESVSAKYELLPRGVYSSSNTKIDNAIFGIDRNTPVELFQARNAVRIARNADAEKYATPTITKASQQLQTAENTYRRGGNAKMVEATARVAVQTAEEARVIAVKQKAEEEEQARADAERQAAEQRAAQARAQAQEEANRRQQAEQARLQAEQARQQAETAKAEAERMKEEAMKAAAEATQAREEAEKARQAAIAEQQEALAQRQAAQAEAENARQAAAKAEAEKGQLRDQLRAQLNSILETNDSARGLIVNMSDVLFDTGSYILKPGAREKLAKVSGILLAHPGLILQVEGHTDSVGSDEYNQQLSEHRANAVREFLMEQGVVPSSITAQGFGKTQPVASNDTPEGRQRNRRVEIVVNGDSIGTFADAGSGPAN
jgi:outer membrane protein OmpA-like peptidoglycan-associated protein